MARWFVDRLPHQGIPSVSLRKLLPEAQFLGCHDWEVSGCTADSRRLDPGQVFVAVRGARHDGHAFVAQALERGAAGVVVERPCPEAGRLQVVVPDSRVAHARLCHALAGDPSRHLLVAGVTGTTGKTAASLFLRSIFEASGLRFGLVGQLGWSEGAGMRPAGSALPRTEGLAAMLAEMVERGCAGGVIEVSGEALDQRRFEGTAFDLAIVTCVSGAPGESAEAVIARRRAKARLLRALAPGGAAIINADDPHAEILGAVNLDARRVTFSLTRAADVTGRVERLGADGSRIVLRGFDREVTVALGLVGPASVTHALAAAAAAWAQGIDTDAVVAGLEAVRTIPGHLEAVDENQDFDVRVDQARDPAALHEALEAVRAIVPGQVHCVVGAEGHRDRSERLALAHVAELGADRLTLTTNNSRTEDPNQILDDLLAGLRRPAWARVEPDRHRAIEMALAAAQPGDGVLIAGKGRHAFQILADRAIPFDDHEVARRWLRGRQERARRTSA